MRNPITQRKLKRLAPPSKIKTTALTTWLKRRGVAMSFAWPILDDLKMTGPRGYEVLGKGAFAVVVVDPSDPKKVIKFTSDASDANTAAELLAMYRDPEQADNAHDVAPMIYGVSEVAYENAKADPTMEPKKFSKLPNKFWIIRLERVAPLSNDYLEKGSPGTGPEISIDALKSLKLTAFIAQSAHSRRTRETEYKVYRRVKSGKAITPQLHQEMLVSLDNLASDLEQTASLLHNPDYLQTFGYMSRDMTYEQGAKAGDLLYAMGGKIRVLIERMDMPMIDLHAGNWGVRIDPGDEGGELDPVIIDFGLSSGGEQREMDKEILELE